MTYEEALGLKQTAEINTIMETGYEYLFLIVPALEKDFLNFMNNYDEKEYTDEICKIYSTNSDYKLHHKMTEESVNRLITKLKYLNQ